MNNYWNIVKKIFVEYFQLLRYYGVAYATYNFVWWINFYVKTPYRFKLSKWALTYKTKYLSNFIERKYPEIISKYSQYQNLLKLETKDVRIWVFWGQGESEMPKLVKACYNQLCRNNSNVKLITADNYKDFVDLSDDILTKCRTGKLSWPHFSDILRNTLLYQQGGLWLDATVWTVGKIPFDIFASMPFFSANGLNSTDRRSMCFWSTLQYNWSSWCMWSNCKGLPLYGFVSDIMKNFALNDIPWPDYVFQDFLYYYAINKFPGIDALFYANSFVKCNYRNYLATLMNQPYEDSLYNKLCENDFVFKLSFRTNWNTKTSSGEETFYGRLIMI